MIRRLWPLLPLMGLAPTGCADPADSASTADSASGATHARNSGPAQVTVQISTSSWEPGDGSRHALIRGTVGFTREGCPRLGSMRGVVWPAGYTSIVKPNRQPGHCHRRRSEDRRGRPGHRWRGRRCRAGQSRDAVHQAGYDPDADPVIGQGCPRRLAEPNVRLRRGSRLWRCAVVTSVRAGPAAGCLGPPGDGAGHTGSCLDTMAAGTDVLIRESRGAPVPASPTNSVGTPSARLSHLDPDSRLRVALGRPGGLRLAR
jgi:hypothetical protein